jgi:serine acetyltransferase
MDNAGGGPSDRYRPDGAGPFGVNDASLVVKEDRSLRTLVALLRSDAQAIRDYWGTSLAQRVYPNLYISWSYRVSHWLHINRARVPAMAVAWLCQALTGCEIRPGAVIGPGFVVVHPTGHVIGGGLIAGRNLTLWARCGTGTTTSKGFSGSPRLGDRVHLGMGAIVMGPRVIGDDVVVGAGVTVTSDVPSGGSTVSSGNAAR